MSEVATIAGYGVKELLLEQIQKRDIEKARGLFTDNLDAVAEAISEYDTSLHKVMNRRDKIVKGKAPYITEKLPRSWQKYINEVAVFFLLNNPIKWISKEQDDNFEIFKDFIKTQRFDSLTREAKRLAGAETHSAKLYHIYQDDGEAKVKCLVLSQSKGYNLYPMIDQWGTMQAFGVGYFLKHGKKSIEHFDIYTSETIYRCQKTDDWQIEHISNPIGKINIIYYQQEKEWAGAQERIERDEMADSKSADTNNYFADPVAVVTTGIINSLPDAQSIGKLLQAQSADDKLEYVEPPSSVSLKESEKKINTNAILIDTLTPDLSFENLRGMGTLSGEALKRALIHGFIKRNKNIEIYEPLIDREKNLILAILGVLHPDKKEAFLNLDISFEFQEPFNEDKDRIVTTLTNAVSGGILSKETAVRLLPMSEHDELERLQKERETQGKETKRQNTQENIGDNKNNSNKIVEKDDNLQS